MLCIYCGESTKVTNSRLLKRTNDVWRRRHCNICSGIFTTHETAAYAGSWAFLAKDGTLHPFVREKLFLSLYESLRHRDNALEDATALIHTVLGKLLPQVANATLDRDRVITTTVGTLQHFDKAAAVSYAAFHPK